MFIVWSLFILLLRTPHSDGFFFPTPGCSSCNCPVCSPPPTCAIPLPCPSTQTYQTSYQGAWTPAIPAFPSAPIYFPSLPAPSYTPSYISNILPTLPTLSPLPMPIQPSQYQSNVPAPPVFTSIPMDPYLQDLQQTSAPTLLPPTGNIVKEYVDQADSLNLYDDTAPALPPPPPSAEPSYIYKTTEKMYPAEQLGEYKARDYQYISQDYGNPAFAEDTKNMHSGETSETSMPKHDIEWPTLPLSRKTVPDGLAPMFSKRHNVFKRMRNSKTMEEASPQHTSNTCNSDKLANIMVRAIVDDVSVSKRMVLRAAEMAFDGEGFDVFCAIGEFSYSIHSRKYCEVTKDDVTCFAFR